MNRLWGGCVTRSIHDLVTPALLVDVDAFEHNLDTMSKALPGARLRPHVKAHKCSAIAARQAAAGHRGFTCATAREAQGLAESGLGEDLLLANELVDATRLSELAELVAAGARVTIAVDSQATIDAAVHAGIKEVVIDVNVGLPRCGCSPDEAGSLAARARGHGLSVRGVMGYEGHIVGLEDRARREEGCAESMQKLKAAHDEVGGELISAGGTGTYDCNHVASEIQAGSYILMDGAYGKLGLPFRQALHLWSTVISVSAKFCVADCGLKSLGMDHGNPTLDGAKVWFCSDEHTTFAPERALAVGDRVRVTPAHVDPTIAYHERIHLVSGDEVLETWPVDLRGW